MDTRRVVGYAVAAVALAAAAVLLAFSTGLIAPFLGDGYDPNAYDPDDSYGGDTDYEHTTVTVVDGETGAELGAVDAAIADTFNKRYLGLSATDGLPEDRGMFFVHDSPDDYTYVMRDMSFGIDIVYADADGTITAVHEAPAPGPDEDGDDHEYPGYGQYVLEVNKGWMADRGAGVGDKLRFEL